MNKMDEMFNSKIEKYLLRKGGHPEIPVGLIKYAEAYKDAVGDKVRQSIALKLLDREIKAFKLIKSKVYKVLGL